MANELFHPEHVSLNTLFTEGANYTIPSYQRPYSWESIGKSDRNNQVNNMWNDFYSFYLNPSNKNKEYFFGSIVVFKNDEELQVVDGQQRLTSVMLLFSAMKCFLEKYKNKLEIGQYTEAQFKSFISDAIMTLNKLMFNETGMGLKRTLKVKIERASGFNFDEILNKVINCEDKNSVLQNIDDKYYEIANRYFENRDYFITKLEETFIENDIFTVSKAENFESFGEFLRTKISIVKINTLNFETAYNIFEVLNNRGLPLSAKDLFRSFLINKLDIVNENNPEKKWNYLEESYEVTSDFLGRFVESRTGVQIQKSFFSEIKDYFMSMNIIGEQNKINNFYEQIENDLKYYTMYVKVDNIKDIKIKNKIKFIRLLSHERYSIDFIISLFRYFNYDGKDNRELFELLTKFELLRLNTLLTPNKRFSSSPIYGAIKALNTRQIDKARTELRVEKSAIAKLKKIINGNIKDNWNGKLLITKYLYTYMSNHKDIVDINLDFKQATLEHICPQNPIKESNWLKFDKSFLKDMTYKLGNFTLLTHNMNSKAKNYAFKKKKEEYKKTSLFLTKELVGLDNIDEKYFKNRQKEMVEVIFDDLGIN